MPSNQADNTGVLPQIPVVEVEADWPIETLRHFYERADALLAGGAMGAPDFAVRFADRVSRRWLHKWDNPRLNEIDCINAIVKRPGAYFLNVSYEWGCTTRVAPGDNALPQLVRTLDWPVPGLGRHVVIAHIKHGPAPWIAPTWPGYTGVLTALAPKRFAAALNQAPMEMPMGFMPVDWIMNRRRVWRSPHPTPAHLLREVFEVCETYAEAKLRLTETPIAAPTFYTLAGCEPEQGCVIERLQTEARVHEIPACVANEWLSPDWRGHVRGPDNSGRREGLTCALIGADSGFDWLQQPVMNTYTRLATVMSPATGDIRVLGIEKEAPATQVFEHRFE